MIDIYSDNNDNYIRYNGDILPLDNSYNIPEKKSNKVPISIKSKVRDKIKISLLSEIDYSVSFGSSSYSIHPGQTQTVRLSQGHDTYTSVYIRKQENPSEEQVELILTYDDKRDVIDTEEKDVKSRINYTYEPDSGIKTFKTENTTENNTKEKYYTDIEIISNAHKIGEFSLVGSGSFRDVYEIVDDSIFNDLNITLDSDDKFVIKIAISMAGVEANKREIQTWNTVKSTELEQYFCPIVHRGPEGKYIIMKKKDNIIKKLRRNRKTELKKELKTILEDNIDEDEISPPINHGYDLGHKNIVKENNNPVLIDYPYGANFEFL